VRSHLFEPECIREEINSSHNYGWDVIGLTVVEQNIHECQNNGCVGFKQMSFSTRV
jgi:hypothetical protein